MTRETAKQIAERTYGSPRFIAIGRNPKLRPPVRWEPLPDLPGVIKI
jgi:hypothetical protein